MSKSKVNFTMITFLIGFMIAIQLKTVNEPEVRDTLDAWQLRESINNEMEFQSKLLQEIRLHESRIHDYNFEQIENKEEILSQTILELKKQAGLTEITGTGLILTVKEIHSAMLMEPVIPIVSPTILQKLINELNLYGAKHLSIDGERYINTTVIREVNGETRVGNHVLRSPFQIVVMAESTEVAEKMYNRLQISPILDDFFIDNFELMVSKPQQVTIPAYVDPIIIKDMTPVEEGDN